MRQLANVEDSVHVDHKVSWGMVPPVAFEVEQGRQSRGHYGIGLVHCRMAGKRTTDCREEQDPEVEELAGPEGMQPVEGRSTAGQMKLCQL